MPTQTQSRNNILLLALYLAALAVVSLLTRGLIPVDETRYTTVAWEMWLRNDWLVPHLNGETYSHKPPLLFWLFMAGWQLFGVNEWWPRLVPFLFSFASLLLVQQLGRSIWPHSNAGLMAPFIVLGFMMYAFFSTAVMFDMMLTFFVLLSITGIYRIMSGGDQRWWLLVGIAWGLGILSKGPVIFVHTLPLILLARFWAPAWPDLSWKKLIAGTVMAVIIAAAIVFAWVLPAIASGGEEYGQQLLFGQNVQRALKAPNDALPWWYYIVFMPLILFPWLYWGGSWKALFSDKGQASDDKNGRKLTLVWMISVFVLFTLISGKKVHYMLPVLPAAALFLSSLLASANQQQARGSGSLLLSVIYLGVAVYIGSLPFWHGETDKPYWMHAVIPYYAIGFVVLALAGPMLAKGNMLKAVRILSLQTVLVLAVAHVSLFTPAEKGYDMKQIAEEIHHLQEQGELIAYNGKYHGEFHFVGRLQKPLQIVYDHTEQQWMKDHPEGWVIRNNYEQCGDNQQPLYYQRLFRNGQCLVIRNPDQQQQYYRDRGLLK
jgi:4-amino-4-deoxy-L-arabinose transferase-like glycosyltransferase